MLVVNERHMKRGFTVLELVVFISLLSIVFIAMAGYTTRLLMTMKINEHRVLANIYAEELQELVFSERESLTWTAFSAKAYTSAAADPSTVAAAERCVNVQIVGSVAIPSTAPPAGTCIENGITGRPPTIYKRTVHLTRDVAAPAQATWVKAVIYVRWHEGSTQYEERLDSVYYR